MCKYCEFDVADRQSLCTIDGEDYFIDDKNIVVFSFDDKFKINYCPMCGRKLGD